MKKQPSSRWSTRSRGRREGLRLGPIIKALIGVFLALLAVVAPINAEDLPDPFQEITGTSQAKAQSAIIEGIPSNCPTDWSPYSREATDPYNPSNPTRASECVFSGGLVCQADPSACEFEDGSVCPVIPWSTAEPKQRMDPSMDIPELCEVETRRVNSNLNHRNNVPFRACGAQGGTRINNNTCLVRVFPVCPEGTYQTPRSSDLGCHGVQRRTWICDAGTIPRNEFNTCYVRPTPQDGMPSGGNPACDIGSPTFEIISCERYVGSDLVADPTSVDCTDLDQFNTGSPDSKMRASRSVGAASDYWCEFNTAFLSINCHTSGTPPAGCSPDWALCLKRASGAGGCTTVAKNIRCRALQSQSISSVGCSPCLVLPFEPEPTHCPDALTSELFPPNSCRSPLFSDNNKLGRDKNNNAISYNSNISIYRNNCSGSTEGTLADQIHQLGVDYYRTVLICRLLANAGQDPLSNNTCLEQPVCQDPPSGKLESTSVHASQLAIVNSPIVFTIHGVPYRKGSIPSYRIELISAASWVSSPPGSPRPSSYSGGQTKIFSLNEQQYLFHESDPPMLNEYKPSLIVRTGMVSRYTPGRQTSIGFGECIAMERPEFRLIIEELWPDKDSVAIKELFGADTLDWWDTLADDQKQARTVASGFLGLYSDLTQEQRQERDERTKTEITCAQRTNNGEAIAGIDCRWVPLRPGYFKVTAAGAWLMRQNLGQRRWLYEELPSGDLQFTTNDVSLLYSRSLEGLRNFLLSRSPLDRAAGAPIIKTDGTCPAGGQTGARWTFGRRLGQWRQEYWVTDRDCIIEHLDENGIDPLMIGLAEDLNGLAPLPADASTAAIYSSGEERYICLDGFAIDLRINCGASGGDSVNYTETNPVGVLVHEIRVNTRMPS